MNDPHDPAELVNEIAVEVNEMLGAGATVVMSIVMGDDGIPMALIGSTGKETPMCLLAAVLPNIAESLREAVAGRKSVRKGILLDINNEN